MPRLAAAPSTERLLARARHLATEGRHAQAAPLLAQAAEAGSSAACLELGRAYLFGNGLPSAPAAAIHWLSKAAESGEVDAQIMLAQLALQGINGSATETPDSLLHAQGVGAADYPAALHWAAMAAQSGAAEGHALVGFIRTNGPQDLRNAEEAAESYRSAAAGGNAQGQLGWALVLLQQETPESLDAARRNLQAAAAAGLPAAECILGVIATSEAAGPVDLAAAAGHFRNAAEAGHAHAQFRYGQALLRGRGVDKDVFAAETWLRRAALAGEAEAAAALGEFYATDGDLPPNYAEAMIWLRQAAEAGHADAARMLAQLHLRGVGGGDPSEAVQWLRQAAQAGNLRARAELAGLALLRVITDTDRHDALACFKELAATGDAGACLNVGLLYHMGIGSARDDRQALIWFTRAADRLPIAQFWCGRMLAEGLGVPQDLRGARGMYLHAARHGCADAQAAAGEMLANGRGGPADPQAAQALFEAAAAQGHSGAMFALGMLARGACGVEPDADAATVFLERAAIQGHAPARRALAGEAGS